MINKELYVPKFVRILSIKNESHLVKTYKLEENADFKPGQFFQVTALGVGEVPISISSSPTERSFIKLTIRNTGKVTRALHSLNRGDFVGLRGPYGNSFPIEDMWNRDLIFVAGGIGLAPIRSLIRYILDNHTKFGHIYLLYGARTPDEIIFKRELGKWKYLKNFDVFLSVDRANDKWKGDVGVVTKLFSKIGSDLKDYIAIVCGPPIMIKYTIQGLVQRQLKPRDIIVSLERHMKCGVGKCGHCYLVDKYVCIDGPVFSYSQLRDIKAIEPLFI
jgi:sulfite reductase subunit B